MAESKRWGRQAATQHESASEFYSDDDVGHVFIGANSVICNMTIPRAAPRRRTTLAVFLLDDSLQFEAVDIAGALKAINVEVKMPPQRVKSASPAVKSAFALPIGEAGVGRLGRWKIHRRVVLGERGFCNPQFFQPKPGLVCRGGGGLARSRSQAR